MPFCCGGITKDDDVTVSPKASKKPTPIFTYFDLAARGEITRLSFLAGDVKFEDKRVSMEEFGGIKSKLPNGQLPVLELDGKQYTETAAIFEYAASRANLLPENPLLRLKIDQLNEFMFEFYVMIRDIFNAEDKAPVVTEVNETRLPEFFQKLENMAQGNDTEGYILGKGLSAADIIVYAAVQMAQHNIFGIKILDIEAFKKECPTLNKVSDTVGKIPAIAEYASKHYKD